MSANGLVTRRESPRLCWRSDIRGGVSRQTDCPGSGYRALADQDLDSGATWSIWGSMSSPFLGLTRRSLGESARVTNFAVRHELYLARLGRALHHSSHIALLGRHTAHLQSAPETRFSLQIMHFHPIHHWPALPWTTRGMSSKIGQNAVQPAGHEDLRSGVPRLTKEKNAAYFQVPLDESGGRSGVFCSRPVKQFPPGVLVLLAANALLQSNNHRASAGFIRGRPFPFSGNHSVCHTVC